MKEVILYQIRLLGINIICILVLIIYVFICICFDVIEN